MKKVSLLLLSALIGGLVSASAVFAIVEQKGFPDVNLEAYYSDGVIKASYEGWMKGYDNGNFGPDDAVTRGQLATILKRYDEEVSRNTSSLNTILCDNKSNATDNIQVEFDDEEEQEAYEEALKSFCEKTVRSSGCKTEFDPKTGEETTTMCI